MENHRETTRSLLTTHHQLLMDHIDTILEDPYLRSCKLPLRFTFGVIPPLDLRLGHLLLLWAKTSFIAGKPVRLLEAEGSGFSKDSTSSWYNLETQRIEEQQNSGNIKSLIWDLREAFQKQRLAVDLKRIIMQLTYPEACSFSTQLRFAHDQFVAGMKKQCPRLSLLQLKTTRLHMTEEGLVRIETGLPKLHKPANSLGLINHKALYYKALVDDLIEELEKKSGFTLSERTDWEQRLIFNKVIDPYADDTLYAPETLDSLGNLIREYFWGMEEINESLAIQK